MSQNPLEGPLFSHRSHLGIFLFFKECADWVSQSLWLHRAESHRKHTAADERVALSAQIHARLWCAQAVWVKPHQAFSMLTYMRKSADWVQPLTYLLMRNWVKRDNSLCRWISALPFIYSLLKAHIECNYGHLAMPAVFNSSPCPPPPPLHILHASLFVNTLISDNQLIRSALRAWTVFRLTCFLHIVHWNRWAMPPWGCLYHNWWVKTFIWYSSSVEGQQLPKFIVCHKG